MKIKIKWPVAAVGRCTAKWNLLDNLQQIIYIKDQLKLIQISLICIYY